MKVKIIILILAFFACSEIFPMRIWEKNLKDHIKALKLKSKLGANHIRKPKEIMSEPMNIFNAGKTQLKKQFKHGEAARLKRSK